MAKQKRAMTKNQLRNLTQFRDMTDEEFEDVWVSYQLEAISTDDFERRIQNKINEFGEDYDLTDLKANDLMSLRALAQAYLSLEDLEIQEYKLKVEEGITYDNLTLIDKIGKMKSDLRSDISRLQDDLKISRKVRDSDKQESVRAYIDDLTEKAREFYKSKMSYVFCPKCNNLLMTAWFHYPEESRNKIWLVCGRETCGHKFSVATDDLIKNRNVNVNNVPEFFKQ